MRRTLFTLSCLLLASMLNASLAGFPSEDQFEKKHTWASLLTGKPLVLIGGNQRKTADYIKTGRRGLIRFWVSARFASDLPT